RRRCVQARDRPRLRDDEPHLTAGRGGLARAEVVLGQLAEGPQDVRPDRVETRDELRQLRILAAAEAGADLDRPRATVLDADLHVPGPALDPDRAARRVGEPEQLSLAIGREVRRVAVRDA